MTMTVMRVSKAQEIFERLVEYVDENHVPLLIAGDRCNAVLISEKDWNAVNETLYLMAIPGMCKSIKKARKQLVAKSRKTLIF